MKRLRGTPESEYWDQRIQVLVTAGTKTSLDALAKTHRLSLSTVCRILLEHGVRTKAARAFVERQRGPRSTSTPPPSTP